MPGQGAPYNHFTCTDGDSRSCGSTEICTGTSTKPSWPCRISSPTGTGGRPACDPTCTTTAQSQGCSGSGGVICSWGYYYCGKTNGCYSGGSQAWCKSDCGISPTVPPNAPTCDPNCGYTGSCKGSGGASCGFGQYYCAATNQCYGSASTCLSACGISSTTCVCQSGRCTNACTGGKAGTACSSNAQCTGTAGGVTCTCDQPGQGAPYNHFTCTDTTKSSYCGSNEICYGSATLPQYPCQIGTSGSNVCQGRADNTQIGTPLPGCSGNSRCCGGVCTNTNYGQCPGSTGVTCTCDTPGLKEPYNHFTCTDSGKSASCSPGYACSSSTPWTYPNFPCQPVSSSNCGSQNQPCCGVPGATTCNKDLTCTNNVCTSGTSGAITCTCDKPGDPTNNHFTCTGTVPNNYCMTGYVCSSSSSWTWPNDPCVPKSSSGSGKCYDGTLPGQCSTNKPQKCEDWGGGLIVLTNKCGECGCPAGQGCTPSIGLCSQSTVTCSGICRTVCFSNENDVGVSGCSQGGITGGKTCCVPSTSSSTSTSTPPSKQTCSDGTSAGQCSVTKPARCYSNPYGSPYLRDDCNTCSCPSDMYCNPIKGQCSPRLNGYENCLADTSTIKKCDGDFLNTYGKGCQVFGNAGDNCPKGQCGYISFMSTTYCDGGCDSTTNTCKPKPPPQPTCSSKGGNCKTVCLNGEQDLGALGCSQGGITGGKTCCVPAGTTPTTTPPSLPPCSSLKDAVCKIVCLNGEFPLQGLCPQSGGGKTCCGINQQTLPPIQLPKCQSGSDVAEVGSCLPGKPPKYCVNVGHSIFTDYCNKCGCPPNWNCDPWLGSCSPSTGNQQFSQASYQYSVAADQSLTFIVPLGNANILNQPLVVSDSPYTNYDVNTGGSVKVITFVWNPDFNVLVNTYYVNPS